MIYYPAKQLLQELFLMVGSIPYGSDRDFICNRYDSSIPLTEREYNRILDLYNKYICVPASIPAWKYDGSNRG